ncbi:MAG: EamA family transporter [Bacteroidales bacterium]|nr:EamA family transporter [Bacteroidales bacterium]
MTGSRSISHFAMIGATLLFSINYWVAKGLMPDHLLPMQIIFLRIAGSLFLFFLLDMMILRVKVNRIERSDMPRIILAGMLGIALNQILFFSGLNLTTPIDTAIINSSNPLMVILLSSILTREKLKVLKLAGIVFGATGAIILVFFSQLNSALEGSFLGNLMILANTLSWSFYLVIAKPLFEKYHPLLVMKWVFFFGFLFSLPFTSSSMFNFSFSGLSLNVIGSILYIVLGTTFLAYLLITYGLKNLSASVVSVYTYMQPVIVAIIGIIFFTEKITLIKVLAIALVFLGVITVSRARK